MNLFYTFEYFKKIQCILFYLIYFYSISIVVENKFVSNNFVSIALLCLLFLKK